MYRQHRTREVRSLPFDTLLWSRRKPCRPNGLTSARPGLPELSVVILGEGALGPALRPGRDAEASSPPRAWSPPTRSRCGTGRGALTRPIARSRGECWRLRSIPGAPRSSRRIRRVPRRPHRARRRARGRPSPRGWQRRVRRRRSSANPPYNSATPILLAAIESAGRDRARRRHAQREVARRLTAGPGSTPMAISRCAPAFARARILFDLPPGAFRLPPEGHFECRRARAPRPRDRAGLRDSIASRRSDFARGARRSPMRCRRPARAKTGSARSRRSAKTRAFARKSSPSRTT